MPRAAALAVTAIVGLTGLVAAGVVPLAGAAPMPMQAAPTLGISLTGQTFALVPGAPWRASYAVVGDLTPVIPPTTTTTTSTTTTLPGTDPALVPPAEPVPEGPPPPETTARVILHHAVPDAGSLAATFDGESTGVVAEIEVPVTLTTTGEQTTFSVEVPTVDPVADEDRDDDDADALELEEPGLHPVDVELRVDGEVVAASRTYVDVPDATVMPATTQVAVVADVTDPGGDPTPAAAAAARAELQALAETADALAGTMTVRIPGPVAADVAAEAPELLARLRSSFVDVELLGVPTPELDPATAVTSGLEDAFSSHLRAGEDLLAGSLALAPPRRSAWLVDDPVSTPAAAMLREPLGFAALVVDRAVYDTLEGNLGDLHDPLLAFAVDLGDGRTLPGLVVSGASTWLDRAQLDARGLTPTDGAVRAMSTLLMSQQLDPSLRRGAVLRLPTGIAPDPEVTAALVEYLATVPGFAVSGLADLPAATDVAVVPGSGPEVVRLPATAGADLSARAASVTAAEERTTAAASMLTDDVQGAAWSASLDALLSTAVTDEEAAAVIEHIDGQVDDLYASVELPRPSTFTLTGRDSTLPLRILNTSATPLRVIVQPSSPKLRFPEGDELVDLAPNTYTDVTIPVEAQTNGTSAIGIELLTPSGGETIQGPVVLTARVNALSGLGQVVTGAAVLVLVSWWYGHFRRRRRARRAMLGEVDNPVPVGEELSPDAAEAVAANGDHPPIDVGPPADGTGHDPHVEVESSDPP